MQPVPHANPKLIIPVPQIRQPQAKWKLRVEGSNIKVTSMSNVSLPTNYTIAMPLLFVKQITYLPNVLSSAVFLKSHER